MFTRKFPLVLTALFIITITNTPLLFSTTGQIPDIQTLETYIVKSDWEAVASIIIPFFDENPEPFPEMPQLRFIAGHAFQANKQNNKASIIFMNPEDAPDSESIAKWEKYTHELADRNPTSSTAKYLYGDALARKGMYNEAKLQFDHALALEPKNYMALNARGVIGWIIAISNPEHSEQKFSFFEDLQKSGSYSYPDAWANLGLISLLNAYSSASALENFQKAIDIDETFAMAFNGKACAYADIGELAKASEELVKANTHCPGLPFVVDNANVLKDSAGTGEKLKEVANTKYAGVKRGIVLNVNVGLTNIFNYSPMNIDNIFNKAPSWTTQTNLGKTYANVSSLKYSPTQNSRGGVYVYAKEGLNLVIDREPSNRAVGTWFVLNYPMPEIKRNIKDANTRLED